MKYPVSQPTLNNNARQYVLECIDENWISSNGKFLERFEEKLSNFLENDDVLLTSNGTVALHLALLALNVQPGDEVLVPSLTYVATANAVRYCGGIPVFVDVNLETWNADAQSFESSITERTVGILAVHIYGSPCDVLSLRDLCRSKGLWLIEDCAEAIGASINGEKVGNFGDIGTFSFYGNKIITTGEGGALTHRNLNLKTHTKLLRGQGMDPDKRYWHTIVGYNYRMTNIAAAIGVSQMEEIEFHLSQRQRILENYVHHLQPLISRGIVKFQEHLVGAKSVNWLTSITVSGGMLNRDQLMNELSNIGIETRPFFYSLDMLPMYPASEMVISRLLSCTGLNLPTYSTLLESDIEEISTAVNKLCLGNK
jgi:perosamine synthetase